MKMQIPYDYKQKVTPQVYHINNAPIKAVDYVQY